MFYSTWFLKTLWSAATNLSGYKCGKSPPIILPLTRSINGPSLPTANTGLSALHRRPPPIPALSFYIKLHHTLLKRLDVEIFNIHIHCASIIISSKLIHFHGSRPSDPFIDSGGTSFAPGQECASLRHPKKSKVPRVWCDKVCLQTMALEYWMFGNVVSDADVIGLWGAPARLYFRECEI